MRAENGWKASAACRDSLLDFVPHPGADTTAQRAVCATCPVRLPCLSFAVAHGEAGVWGGTSENERGGTPSRPRPPRPRRLAEPLILDHLDRHGAYTGRLRSLEQRLGLPRLVGTQAVRRLEEKGEVTVEPVAGAVYTIRRAS